GDASAPVFLSQPKGDFRPACLFITHDASHHATVTDNGLWNDGRGGEYPLPTRGEGFPVGRVLGREGSRVIGLHVQLLLEEYGQVVFDCIPQVESTGHRSIDE